MKHAFTIGDRVKIISIGVVYGNYALAADVMRLSYFRSGWCSGDKGLKGLEGTIVAMTIHPTNGRTLCGVRIRSREGSVNEIIIEDIGLKLIQPVAHLPEDLFTL